MLGAHERLRQIVSDGALIHMGQEFFLSQVDVAASSAAEAVIGQMREVLTAAAAGAGVADGLPAKLHATVFLPLVSSESQASSYFAPSTRSGP